MNEFKKELRELLDKYNAYIFVDEDDGVLELGIGKYIEDSDFTDEKLVIDSGYRDLKI